MRTTTQKKTEHNEMYKLKQDLLSVPRGKACREDTACDIRAHMTMTAAKLQHTSYISLAIRCG